MESESPGRIRSSQPPSGCSIQSGRKRFRPIVCYGLLVFTTLFVPGADGWAGLGPFCELMEPGFVELPLLERVSVPVPPASFEPVGPQPARKAAAAKIINFFFNIRLDPWLSFLYPQIEPLWGIDSMGN